MRGSVKRWLFLTHRWLGIVLCLLFVMWFVSGMVMMYVGYPKLTPDERRLHLPVLAADAELLSPAQALRQAGVSGPLADLRLAAASGGQAVYLVRPLRAEPTGSGHGMGSHGASAGGTLVIDARRGERLMDVAPERALASAAAYMAPDGAARGAAAPSAGSDHGLRYLGQVDGEDAFTHARSLDAHRPLHRVQLPDAADTWLYVSGRTGEVVLDAARTERLWSYVGTWIHWLYPFRGTALDRYWSDIVIWLSIAGVVVTLVGSYVGIQRWRFRQAYRSGSHSPYQPGMMRWHHIVGLLFALTTFTWIFSGLMSMNPWRIFDAGAAPLQTRALQGEPLAVPRDGPAGALDQPPQALLRAAGAPVRELRWVPVLGRVTALAHGASPRPQVLDGQTAQALSLDADALRTAAQGLMQYPIARVDVMNEYDLYYYARAAHTMTGGNERPLPVWRVVFDDPQATWVHLDPHTGAILGQLDTRRRVSRWLFTLLHSWDWLPLLTRRPLWDGLMLALSLGGVLLSATGVVIGWRRLRLKLR
ncbi:peptidase [Comamonas serinivorans]|uniref:Peptidase n=1 Tax=Comamonas serinivorans TaxID=1082851 RepID=A0A1Y0EKS0_9BURK|nr:PepSY domain-containing protein [Comamonas serinivorans]ARU04040.1 peptidase [Comamonas serinivorans]